jgi:hypothetical protein
MVLFPTKQPKSREAAAVLDSLKWRHRHRTHQDDSDIDSDKTRVLSSAATKAKVSYCATDSRTYGLSFILTETGHYRCHPSDPYYAELRYKSHAAPHIHIDTDGEA